MGPQVAELGRAALLRWADSCPPEPTLHIFPQLPGSYLSLKSPGQSSLLFSTDGESAAREGDVLFADHTALRKTQPDQGPRFSDFQASVKNQP